MSRKESYVDESATAQEASAEPVFLVRIRPPLRVNEFNEFLYGNPHDEPNAPLWHRVDASKAAWCRTRKANDMRGAPPLVFDVIEASSLDEAAVKAEALDASYTANDYAKIEDLFVREGWNGRDTLFSENAPSSYDRKRRGSPWSPIEPPAPRAAPAAP
mgnify:CR=1 FL=1